MAWINVGFVLYLFTLEFHLHLHDNWVTCWTWTNDDTQLVADERYKLGEEKINELRRLTTMPKYSHCWTKALDDLETGCQHLSDDMQHRMALQFTNCFLLKTGRTTYPCEKTDEISKCTKEMPSEAYSVHAQFFTHTQNMCFFLQAQVWQEETGKTIIRLSNTSETVTQQLQEASELQGKMLQDQNKSLENQGVLLNRGLELKKTLEESSIDVHRMLDDFKNSTKEQKMLLFEVFDRLNSLQSLVMWEFTGYYSYIFYTLSILISYLLTSTPRTGGARIWLFVLMTLNILFERLLVWWGGTSVATISQSTESTTSQNKHIYEQLWQCRKVFILLCLGVYGWFAYNYRDLNRINNQLLVDIKRQNADLKHLLQSGHSPSRLQSPAPEVMSTDTEASDCMARPEVATVGRQVWPVTSRHSLASNSSTGYESDSAESSSSSSATDHTFLVDNEDDISDTDSVSTASGQTSRSDMASLLGELHFLRESTPIRELAQAEHTSIVRRVGRPRGSRSTTPVTSPKVARPGLSRYNLRSRGNITDNKCVHSETPSEFKHKVKHLARIAQRNSRLVRTMQNRGQLLAKDRPLFSSDDD